MNELVAVALPGGPQFVATLERLWADGDAVLPVDPRLPPPARSALFEAMHPSRLIDAAGDASPLMNGLPTLEGDALVVPTSGSTGRPKGVVHTHDSLRASARSTSLALDVDPERDRWLCPLPLSHIAGLAVIMRARWAGVPVEVHPRFDPAEVEAAARDRGATLTSLVPTALARIDSSLFRRIIVGGAAPPADRPANVVATYGMTETGSAIVFDGCALTDVELRIADGEIHVRGPMLLRAYRDGTDPRTTDGWLPTGDLGALDADGTLSVHGRRGDLIITGGENVWPAPVEQTPGHASGGGRGGRDRPSRPGVGPDRLGDRRARRSHHAALARRPPGSGEGAAPPLLRSPPARTGRGLPRNTLGKVLRSQL